MLWTRLLHQTLQNKEKTKTDFFIKSVFLFYFLWHTYIIKVIEKLEVLNVYLAIFLLNRQKEEKYISKIITFLNKNKNV